MDPSPTRIEMPAERELTSLLPPAWAESDLYMATRERFERLLIRILKSLLDSPGMVSLVARVASEGSVADRCLSHAARDKRQHSTHRYRPIICLDGPHLRLDCPRRRGNGASVAHVRPRSA